MFSLQRSSTGGARHTRRYGRLSVPAHIKLAARKTPDSTCQCHSSNSFHFGAITVHVYAPLSLSLSLSLSLLSHMHTLLVPYLQTNERIHTQARTKTHTSVHTHTCAHTLRGRHYAGVKARRWQQSLFPSHQQSPPSSPIFLCIEKCFRWPSQQASSR